MSGSNGSRIVVAVLTRPGADPAGALEALWAAEANEVVVVELDRPGAWAAARNTALQRAADADILALVDDDVRVAPGWGAALRTAFAGPRAPRRAAVGGPVRARHAPPGLDVGAHALVLGLGTPGGPEPALVAGNAAFRTAALRGIGGFFPVRGHRDAHDGLGDWQRALQELAAVGWEVVADPALVAERDLAGVDARELLRRRLRTGARSAALDPRATPAAALQLAARAGAAAAVRAVRGDRAGALGRAAWAAAGLGGLLGGRLAHGELQPDRARTPLRPAVPPPARRRAPRPQRPTTPVQGAILLYHRIVDGAPDPLGLAVTPERFAAQLAVLARDFRPVSLVDLLAGRGGARAVALTFDDGYHDNLLHALPALRAAGVPATLFVSTGHVATGAGFWWDTVTRLLGGGGDDRVLELAVPGGARAWAPRTPAQRDAVRAFVHAALQTRDAATIDAALRTLSAWAGQPIDGPERDRPMTIDELRALAAAGPLTIGAHGRTHLSLAFAPPAVRAAELRGSADDLEQWLGVRPRAFSYPFGVPGVDVDPVTIAAARDAGYAAATVNAPGVVCAGTDRHALPRLAVPDVDGPAFGRWLRAALR